VLHPNNMQIAKSFNQEFGVFTHFYVSIFKRFYQGCISYSSDENFGELLYGWFFIIFHRLLIDFA